MKKPSKDYIESINLHFDNTELRKEFKTGSDRVVAILACSIIDLKLRRILEEYLLNDTKVLNGMFDALGSLNTLSAKIKLTYLLKLIPKEIYQDIEIIRNIRNVFAHNIDGCNFEDPEISNLMDKLNLFKVKPPYACARKPNRQGFILMVLLLEPLLSRTPTILSFPNLNEINNYESILKQIIDSKNNKRN